MYYVAWCKAGSLSSFLTFLACILVQLFLGLNKVTIIFLGLCRALIVCIQNTTPHNLIKFWGRFMSVTFVKTGKIKFPISTLNINSRAPIIYYIHTMILFEENTFYSKFHDHKIE